MWAWKHVFDCSQETTILGGGREPQDLGRRLVSLRLLRRGFRASRNRRGVWRGNWRFSHIASSEFAADDIKAGFAFERFEASDQFAHQFFNPAEHLGDFTFEVMGCDGSGDCNNQTRKCCHEGFVDTDRQKVGSVLTRCQLRRIVESSNQTPHRTEQSQQRRDTGSEIEPPNIGIGAIDLPLGSFADCIRDFRLGPAC